MRLGVNIDHVATIRQARKTDEPQPLKAALIAEQAGADQITIHLRADRRHIQDGDARTIKSNIRIPLNIEMSVKKEMRELAARIKPHKVTLVPERRTEVTTEGGLDVIKKSNLIAKFQKAMDPRFTSISIFVDPEIEQLKACIELDIKEVEFNTGCYADAKDQESREREIKRLQDACTFAASHGMVIAAGHGLTVKNLPPILKIKEIEELNIGHHIIAEAVFMGLDTKIRELIKFINR
jgi:pyridoxine 5-phosphate synthase